MGKNTGKKQSALCKTDKGKLFRKTDRKLEPQYRYGKTKGRRNCPGKYKDAQLKKKKKVEERQREEWKFAE